MKQIVAENGRAARLSVAALIMILIGCKPFPPDAADYLAVSAHSRSERVSATELGLSLFPKHAVVQDRLYLQVTASSDFGPFEFSTVEVWDQEAISRFRKEHPELERYSPKPEQDDGGVAWCSMKSGAR